MNCETFEQTGRLWLRGGLDSECLHLLDQTGLRDTQAGARLQHQGSLSNVLGHGGAVAQALYPLLPKAFPTRTVMFNKTGQANWSVPWHQDRVIRVAERADAPLVTNWSQKAGDWHCEPPITVLDKMLFVRLYLDDETETTGPMQIALGSHKRGKIPAPQSTQIAQLHEVETCLAKRGDILVLKMLTLHRSGVAQQSTSRRVVRVDYANSALPPPLRWAA